MGNPESQPAEPPGVAPGLLERELEPLSRVDEITDRLVTAVAIGEYLPG